jgi:hypothetical protein
MIVTHGSYLNGINMLIHISLSLVIHYGMLFSKKEVEFITACLLLSIECSVHLVYTYLVVL